jgi:hypothetical protein
MPALILSLHFVVPACGVTADYLPPESRCVEVFRDLRHLPVPREKVEDPPGDCLLKAFLNRFMNYILEMEMVASCFEPRVH